MNKLLFLFLALLPMAASADIRAVSPIRPSTEPFDVRGTGVDCGGASDSTAAFQAAISNYSAVYVPSGCTLLLNAITLPAKIHLFGGGPTSVLKHVNSATGHMLLQANSASQMLIHDLTIDGNYLNNGGDGPGAQSWGSIRINAGGLSETQPSVVHIHDVTFVNAGFADISTFYSDPPGPLFYQEENTSHLGGADSFGYGAFSGAVKATLNNIVMDPQRLPTGATAQGIAGYAFFRTGSTSASLNSVTANNIQCYNTGISGDSLQLGCIDGYHAGDHYIITNSFSKNAIGRGFIVKGDASNVILANLLVSNLAGNPSNSTGNDVGACGAVFVGDGTGANVLIDNFSCINSGHDGIVLDASGSPPTGVVNNVTINNVFINGCGSARNGLYLTNATNVKVTGGLIMGCAVPIFANQTSSYTPGPLTISGANLLTGKPNMVGMQSYGLWYTPEVQTAAYSLSDLTLTVSSNTVTAWTPAIVVDTSGGAQTVTTISGVPDGKEITVQTNSASHALALQTGGNLSLGGTLTISDTTTVYRFKSVAGNLYRVQ